MKAKLERIGEGYYESRCQLMQKLQLGLTKTYNQFHNTVLTGEIVSRDVANRKELEKKFGKEMKIFIAGLVKLRGCDEA